MKLRAKVTAILEHAYAPEPDEQKWLEGIQRAADVAFAGQVTTQAYTAEVRPDGRIGFGSIVGPERANEAIRWIHDAAEPEVLRQLYLAGPVKRLAPILARSRNEALHAAFGASTARGHYADVVGAIGTDATGRTCSMAFALRKPSVAAALRTTLSRLAGHLAASYRLRGGAPVESDAVLDPSGRLLDARDGALVDRSGPTLREAALAIDRARREEREDPARALAAWNAMVEGQWTLVERFESDGRRIFLAQPNEPATREARALTAAERKVVALVALCHPSKLVAYELGMSEATVSALLSSALRKLGVRTRAELVQLHGAIASHGEGPIER